MTTKALLIEAPDESDGRTWWYPVTNSGPLSWDGSLLDGEDDEKNKNRRARFPNEDTARVWASQAGVVFDEQLVNELVFLQQDRGDSHYQLDLTHHVRSIDDVRRFARKHSLLVVYQGRLL